MSSFYIGGQLSISIYGVL